MPAAPSAGLQYARGLPAFLRTPISSADARRTVSDSLAVREATFLRVLEHAVFSRPRTPYARLLQAAGVERGDAAEAVRRDGIDGALAALYEAGVYLTLEEFKGHRPIERSGLRIDVSAADFDNPMVGASFGAETGGSRTSARRVAVDLDLLTREAAYVSLALEAFGWKRRPLIVWHPVPPAVSGLKTVLRHAKAGQPIDRWFTPTELSLRPTNAKDLALLEYTIRASRWARAPLPRPQHAPVDEPERIAPWLARHPGCVIAATPSCAVRLAEAWRDHADATGFLLGGEPFSDPKARVLAAAGARACAHYALAEAGLVGLPCADPRAPDEVHLATDKVAVLQRARKPTSGGPTVQAMLLTTLFPSSPKLMLNVEVGDYAVVDERSCACPADEVGLTLHAREIRSYEKLTTQGAAFLGSELMTLLEDVLPGRFGGSPSDYQLVEDEDDDGTRSVVVVVSPRIGPVEDEQVVAVVLETLSQGRADRRMMAGIWKDASTLRVVRREPYATGAGKILPLHLRARDLAERR